MTEYDHHFLADRRIWTCYHINTMKQEAIDRIEGGTLDEIVRRIVAAIDPDKIILFGSRARGDSRPDSDYDLLVVKDTTERTLKLEQRAYRAMLGVLGPADILVETPQRLNALRDATGCVYRDALKEGHVVYERPAA